MFLRSKKPKQCTADAGLPLVESTSASEFFPRFLGRSVLSYSLSPSIPRIAFPGHTGSSVLRHRRPPNSTHPHRHAGLDLANVPVRSGLWGYYHGDSWTGTQWTDLSGSGRHATVTKGALLKNVGGINGETYVYGSTTAGVTFPQVRWPI